MRITFTTLNPPNFVFFNSDDQWQGEMNQESREMNLCIIVWSLVDHSGVERPCALPQLFMKVISGKSQTVPWKIIQGLPSSLNHKMTRDIVYARTRMWFPVWWNCDETPDWIQSSSLAQIPTRLREYTLFFIRTMLIRTLRLRLPQKLRTL